jgi:hypothetical protein
MRFVGGTYDDEVDGTLLTDAQRAEVDAIAATGDGHRGQQLVESCERRAIRAASDEDGQALDEFASERGEGDELHQFPPAERGAMRIDTPVPQVGTPPNQFSNPGLLSRLFLRAASAPTIACALLLLAVLAASGLLIVAAHKLGVQ